MERYIGIDVHAASCTLTVISEKDRKLKDFPVETHGQALVEAVRMILGHKHWFMDNKARPVVDRVLCAAPFDAFNGSQL